LTLIIAAISSAVSTFRNLMIMVKVAGVVRDIRDRVVGAELM
jgi:hypothetical protein